MLSFLLLPQVASMDKPIIIRRKNALRKVEIPILGATFFYLFMFFAMASGDLALMFSKLFSVDDGIIGFTVAVFGFAGSVLLNFLHLSKISLDDKRINVISRLGFKKGYELAALEKCFIKWYDGKDRRYPFFQFNFADGKKLQFAGHHFKGLNH